MQKRNKKNSDEIIEQAFGSPGQEARAVQTTALFSIPSGNFSRRKKFVYGLLAFLALSVIIAVIVQNFSLRSQVRNLEGKLAVSGQEQTADETGQIIEAVGRLIILPAGEQPAIATVSDTQKLAGQQFFANAKVGDKVLIYTQSKKAILFRPSENRLIEIAPISAGSENATTAPVSGSEPVARVYNLEIRNASGKPGAAAAMAEKFKNLPQFSVAKIGNASSVRPDTSVTASVSLTDAAESLIKEIIPQAEMQAPLPEGEPPSLADILIILGSR